MLEKGAAVTDPLSQIQYPKEIQELVIGHAWADILVKSELYQIRNIDDMFNALPYLDILTKTNTTINIEKAINITFDQDTHSTSNIKLPALALTYCCMNQKPIYQLNSAIYTNNHDTLLTFAVRHNAFFAVSELLKNPNINVNETTEHYRFGDWEGTSPLDLAMRKNSPEIVSILLKHNAKLIEKEYNEDCGDISHPCEASDSKIAVWATSNNYPEILQILKSKPDIYTI